MARLAAYYQEDFHYPPSGYGHKERKSAYVLYEEPKQLPHNQQLFNGPRIRSLGTSEPSLSPTHTRTPRGGMTFKQKPLMYSSQIIDSSNSSIPYLSDSCNGRHQRFEPEYFDDESLSSYCDVSFHENRYNQRLVPHQLEKSRKRFSYAEPSDGFQSPEICFDRRFLLESDIRNYNHKGMHPDNYYVNPSEQNYLQRPESRQTGKWHWHTQNNAYSNATYLSPPSPLDSGLSSQSITSSPSLEAEPMPFRSDVYQTRLGRHSDCSCPKMSLAKPREQFPSGRISPGGCSLTRSVSATPRPKNRLPLLNKRISYAGENFDNHILSTDQVRYGKMGILGERTNSDHVSVTRQLDNIRTCNFPPNSMSYIYTDQNGSPLKKAQRRKSHKSGSNYNSPCLIIIESPEKNGCDDADSSPGRETSDKSPAPESPMSCTASNSDSPSVSSSNNELDIDDHSRPPSKSNDKATELEIRELEAMYEKCNLSDRDLFDRAERRDLPIPHQIRTERGRLTRSNSDTLYEVMSPIFHNPYEAPRRAPPSRRSGMPDRIADDMAHRKHQHPVSNSPFSLAENSISYMLCSSHFTPTVPCRNDILSLDHPDVELDDLSYRKHYFGKKSKILDPQPPFGIPLKPPPPQKIFNDYLHAIPNQGPPPLCHPRGNPDVVRDDLAFRALRKDEPDRMYYDISQLYRKQRI